MSFLASLLCCFDGDDRGDRTGAASASASARDARPRPRPHLSKTQSNLQKALTNGHGHGHATATATATVTATATATASARDAAVVPLAAPPVHGHSDPQDDAGDSKDSTDSSKDEDDAVRVHVHDTQTQDTDERAAVEEEDEEDVGSEDNASEDASASPSISPFGMDLATILPDQTVSKSGWLLDAPPASLRGRKCLVLDLDETLVHSSFKYVRQCDFVIPVEIENQVHNVYVIKRPGVDEFLKRVGQLFEVVVFTASVSRYGDPLLDILDVHKSVHQRLFRDSCYNYQGNYIKNLSQMGRPLQDLIIIDNSPASYVFHPQHAVPISSWFSDSHDCELTDILPFLEDLAADRVDDIRLVLDINV